MAPRCWGASPASASASFTASSGNQTLYVVGAPAAAEASGSFGITISPEAGGDPAFSDRRHLAATREHESGAELDRAFTVTAPGNYTLT